MNPNDPQFLFIALILPSLFALTFLAEGIHRLLSKEPPWISFALGFGFLILILVFYFGVLQ